MSDYFQPLTADEWQEQGGVGNTERGLYGTVLSEFVGSGQRYAVISMARGKFAGKKASSVATALKTTRDGKSAPDGVEGIKVKSRAANTEKGIEGAVFLENTAVEG